MRNTQKTPNGGLVLTGYALRDRETGQFQGIDYPSGGYPYGTDYINSVHVWVDVMEAVNYVKSFSKLQIVPITLELKIGGDDKLEQEILDRLADLDAERGRLRQVLLEK